MTSAGKNRKRVYMNQSQINYQVKKKNKTRKLKKKSNFAQYIHCKYYRKMTVEKIA